MIQIGEPSKLVLASATSENRSFRGAGHNDFLSSTAHTMSLHCNEICLQHELIRGLLKRRPSGQLPLLSILAAVSAMLRSGSMPQAHPLSLTSR